MAGGQYILKGVKKGLSKLAKEAEAGAGKVVERKSPKAAAKEDRLTVPAEAKPEGKKLTKPEREAAQLDAATKRVEEAFKPYEGAKPNVPQVVFPRVSTGNQSIDEVILRAISNRDVKDAMMAGIERGKPLSGWYNMEPTRLLWGDITGSQAIGDQRFNRLQDFMGPTSILTKVDPNIGNASRWNFYEINGLPPPETLDETGKSLATKPPPGYGGPGQINQYKAAMPMLESGQPMDPVKYPKTSRYGGALKGNVANLPVDRHAVRAPLMLLGDPGGLARSVKLDKGTPAFNAQTRFAEEGGNLSDVPITWWKDEPANLAEYYAMEDYYKMLAAEAGLAPAEGQASGWVGHAGMTRVETDPSLTAQQLFNRRVAGQAIKRNQDPRDLLRDVMLGKSHLGIAGAGGAALLGSQLLPGGDIRDEEQL